MYKNKEYWADKKLSAMTWQELQELGGDEAIIPKTRVELLEMDLSKLSQEERQKVARALQNKHKIETEEGYFEIEKLEKDTFCISVHNDSVWETTHIANVSLVNLIRIQDLITQLIGGKQMSMNYNEEEELKTVSNEQPTDHEIITALRFELIRTQKAYLLEQSKVIGMQIELLDKDEQRLLADKN